jgi:hypothetical protein
MRIAFSIRVAAAFVRKRRRVYALAACVCVVPQVSAAQDTTLPGWTSTPRNEWTLYTHSATRASIVIREFPDLAQRPLADVVTMFTASVRGTCENVANAPIVSEAGGAIAVRTDNGAARRCVVMAIRGAGRTFVAIGSAPNDVRVDVNAVSHTLARRYVPENTASAVPPVRDPAPIVPARGPTAALTNAWPTGGRVPSTVADVDWYQAIAMGINPVHDLRPARYECFATGSARRVNPVADGVLSVATGGGYRYQTPQGASDGRWQRLPGSSSQSSYQFSGPLSTRLQYVANTNFGQHISLTETATDREMRCYLAGPYAELARLQMVNTMITSETLSCRFGENAITPVTFSGGRYTSQRGSGIYRDYSLTNSQKEWEGGFEFDGGPFEHARGYLRIDKQGRRILSIGVTVNTSRGYWYSSDETTPVAECLSATPVRATPEYGTQPAPVSRVTGGPSGVFAFVGADYRGFATVKVNSFTPNGWYADDVPEGHDVDCTRTKPSGEPVCLSYELQPGRIRLQYTTGTWAQADWVALQTSPLGMVIDDVNYRRVAHLTGLRLSGTYGTQSSSSSGSIAGTLTTLISEGTYVFSANGTFRASSSLFARTGIGPGIGGSSPIVGSWSNNSNGASEGRYRIEGNWLVLTTNDGREARQFIHVGMEDTPRGTSPEFLYIGNDLYSKNP